MSLSFERKGLAASPALSSNEVVAPGAPSPATDTHASAGDLPGAEVERLTVRVAPLSSAPLVRSFPLGVEVVFGRGSGCHLVLASGYVSRRHLSVRMDSTAIFVRDSSTLGTKVNGQLLHGTEKLFSESHLELQLGPYRIELERALRHLQSADLRRRIHAELLSRMKLDRRELAVRVTDALREEVNRTLSAIVAEAPFGVPAPDRARLGAELADEVLGLGPLEGLLADDGVSEVMVVDPETIYAERSGKLELTGRTFSDREAVVSAIERIVTPLGRRIDESSPLVDARLPDGSRVNAVIPPLALRGPCITIRKFPKKRLSLEELVSLGSLTTKMARFLTRAVQLRKNIVISGGTGSGKTTLLNVLSTAIDPGERIVTIEDAAELNLGQPHVVGLESKPPNLEGNGEVTIRSLVKNALRMRPDRIIVGECRGGEALDMLQAMNTGHDGSMTTTHANSPRQAMARLETLCLMSGLELPLSAIRRQIVESVDLVLQQSRLSDGSRKITHIGEVTGRDERGDIEVRPLFSLEYDSQMGRHCHVATGFMPTFLPELARAFGHEDVEVF